MIDAMNKDYKDKFITVKDFASRVGISTQAVYQRLDKDLKKYLQVINGKKMLKISVIEDMIDKNDSAKQVTCDKVSCKEIDNQVAKNFASGLQADEKTLQPDKSSFQEVLKVLSEQLEEKDKQIKALQEELNLQNEHARKQSDRLVGLIEQVNELQRNNQVLLAQKDINSAKEIESKKESKGIFKRWFKKNDD